MKKLWMIVAWAFFLTGCNADRLVPTHLATVNVGYENYSEFLMLMDATLSPFGLVRSEDASGLNDLRGRVVLFGAYKKDKKSIRAALDMTDIKSAGKIEIFVYADYFVDLEMRKNFICQLNEVMRRFGSAIVENKI